ncbi:MAG: tetratricopeptide (TPR) repeat protein, partial [Kiritimatiellia bacterium]
GRLADAIARQGAQLLVLDNVEQVIDAVVELVAVVDFDVVSLLITSREVLRVSGEQVIDVSTLSLSHSRDLLRRLAHARHRSWAPDEADLQELVLATDGLPLAIEIVAARVHVLTAPELTARVGTLPDRRRGRVPRHGSVHAALLWSWSRMSAELRDAMLSLAVVPGQAPLETASLVLQLSDDSSIDCITDLRDQSMLQPSGDMLELVRAFVLGQFDGDHVRSAQLRHARACLHIAQKLSALHEQERFVALTARVGLERLCVAQGVTADADPLVSLDLTDLAAALVRNAGPEVRLGLLLEALPRESLPDDRARLRHQLIELGHRSRNGRPDGDLIEEAMSVAEALGDRELEAQVWAAIAHRPNLPNALDAVHRVLDLSRDPNLRAKALRMKLYYTSEPDQALQVYERIGDEVRLGADPSLRIDARISVATSLRMTRPALALQMLREADAQARDGDSLRQKAGATVQLAMLLAFTGDMDEALGFALEAQRQFADLAHQVNEGVALEFSATCLFCLGELDRSARHEARSRALYRAADRDDLVDGLCNVRGSLRLVRGGDVEADLMSERAHAALRYLALARGGARPDGCDAPWCHAVDRLLEGEAPGASGDAMLDAFLHRLYVESCRVSLVVSTDGKGVQRDSAMIDLSRRSAPRAILLALSQAHPSPLTGDELFRAGWPGQNILAQAAKHRLHVALSTLRKLGLSGLILFDGDHYSLAPEVVLSWRD